MAKLYAMYRHPADPAAFDRYYYATHVPVAKKVPGLRHYEVTSGSVAAVGGGGAPYHLIAVLTFDSLDAIGAALASRRDRRLRPTSPTSRRVASTCTWPTPGRSE